MITSALSRLSDTSIRADSRQVQTKALKITQAVNREAGVLCGGRLYFLLCVRSCGNELEAQLRRFLLHVFDLLFFIFLFVFGHIDLIVFDFVL